jgi:hypothetical protein
LTVEGLLRFAHRERSPRHTLHAARDDEIGVTRPDSGDRVGDSFEPRPAQAVHRDRRHLVREAREECGHTSDVAVVLARLVGRAENDMVDAWREAWRSLEECVHDVSREIVRADPRESTAIAGNRRAHGVD